MKFYHAKERPLFVLMICAFLWSCGGSGGSGSTANEPVEEEEVVESTAPEIQAPTPLIYLADNLDEPEQLGWCIDTRGVDFNEELHTHSCKPSGGDVQFTYDEQTLQICSVLYPEYCVEMSDGVSAGMGLSLVLSVPNSRDQWFFYDEETGEFNPEMDTSLCLAAGDTSVEAGIYVARTLTLEISSETDESLKKWIIATD